MMLVILVHRLHFEYKTEGTHSVLVQKRLGRKVGRSEIKGVQHCIMELGLSRAGEKQLLGNFSPRWRHM